jgi:hypothetical protein
LNDFPLNPFEQEMLQYPVKFLEDEQDKILDRAEDSELKGCFQ